MLRRRAAMVCLVCACRQDPPTAAMAPLPPAEVPSHEVLDASYSEVYQLFLLRTLNDRDKAERWALKYKDRWVRWTGQLAAFSASGIKVRHLRSTVTFDVSVVINEPQRSQLRRQMTVGKFYTYVARLERFDDLFRSLYLNQGVVIRPSLEGVPGELASTPRPLPMPPSAPAPPRRQGVENPTDP